MKLKIRLFSIPVIILCLGIVLAVPASAQIPTIPAAFYGDVQINGEPAPVGTEVEVRGEGVIVGLEGNPIITTEVGKYGTEGPFGAKLIAQGDIEGNPVLSFYVNGQPTGQTITFPTEVLTRLDLTLTVSSTTPPTQPSILQGVLFGEELNIDISDTGEILETIEVSADLPEGIVQMNIEAGTIALSQGGSPLTNLTSEVDLTPPPVPEDYNSIYIPCNFGPAGATFNPPIELIFNYDPADIPENTNEEDLVVAFYDNSVGKWVTLPSVVDTVNNTVTALVNHFTSFAILVPEAELPEETTPATPTPATPTPATPTPATPTPATPTPATPTPAAPSPAVSPSPAPLPPEPSSSTPAPEEAPLPTTTPEQPGVTINWPVLGGVIAAGVLIIVIIIFRRMRLRD